MSNFKPATEFDLSLFNIPEGSQILEFSGKNFEATCIYYIDQAGQPQTAVYVEYGLDTCPDDAWYKKQGDFREECKTLAKCKDSQCLFYELDKSWQQ